MRFQKSKKIFGCMWVIIFLVALVSVFFMACGGGKIENLDSAGKSGQTMVDDGAGGGSGLLGQECETSFDCLPGKACKNGYCVTFLCN